MTNKEAIEIIRKEYLCVDRDCDIDKSCGKCDLMMPSKEPILEAYKVAIKALEQEPKTEKVIKMRDATPEERESVDKYVKSISKPTGVNFWDLEQEPCEDAISRKAVHELVRSLTRWYVRSEDGKFNNVGLLYDDVMFGIDRLPSTNPQPCNDAISRQAVQDYIAKYLSQYLYNDVREAVEVIDEYIGELPSVKPQEPKWDRLYSWLNDMRLGIAPDETVTDIDERNERIAQTDLLDDIMEWMLKQEPKEGSK